MAVNTQVSHSVWNTLQYAAVAAGYKFVATRNRRRLLLRGLRVTWDTLYNTGQWRCLYKQANTVVIYKELHYSITIHTYTW